MFFNLMPLSLANEDGRYTPAMKSDRFDLKGQISSQNISISDSSKSVLLLTRIMQLKNAITPKAHFPLLSFLIIAKSGTSNNKLGIDSFENVSFKNN